MKSKIIKISEINKIIKKLGKTHLKIINQIINKRITIKKLIILLKNLKINKI